ncbi:MAG: hypothetical protein AAGF90_05435 [Pseudomonadota bacterium]
MLFAALLRLSGLSPDDAVAFLGVRRKMINAWMRPDGSPAQKSMQKLYDLIDRQEREAERLIEEWDEAGRPETFEGEVAGSDEAAQAAGWPSVGAQAVPFAIAQATLVHVRMRVDVVEPVEAVETEEEES